MFKRKSAAYNDAEEVMRSLAFSFLRGSVNDSREARNELGDRLAVIASRLTSKEKAKLRANPPDIVHGFPPEGRHNFNSFLDHAFR